MVFNTLLIIISTVFLVITYMDENLTLTPFVLLALVILQIFLINKKQKSDQNKIITYLESVIIDETTHIAPWKNKGLYFRIADTLENIRMRFHNSNRENQEQAELLNAIINHINIGLITFNRNGEVEILNRSARTLLSISYLHNVKEINQLSAEDRNTLLDFDADIGKIYTLTDKKTVYIESYNFTLNENPVRIISIQNINKTLDEKEMESWNRLVRTLNHEIINSITPISSLASTALSMVEEEKNQDLAEAVQTIEKRSRNLIRFVENYRTLSRIPQPGKEIINLHDLISRIILLMTPSLQETDTRLNLNIQDHQILLSADPSLVEQILINLIKNSIEATASEITVSAEISESSCVTINVSDNGSGFSDESESRAFIPFYTTKSRGSGLGLSIVRQIMHLHEGEVKIESAPGISIISLHFP